MTASWTTLVDAHALADALAGTAPPVVIDCRFSLADTSAGALAYAESHVPGAHYAHLDHDLSGPHDALGAGRHPWPPEAVLAAFCARAGIVPGRRVVAYDDGDGAFAARLWWLLRVAGHRDVAVLDGGWAAWRAAGLAESGEPVATAAPASPWQPEFDRAWLVDADGVSRHLAQGGLLIDARATPRFRGEVEPIDARAGHVPGAVSRPYGDNLVEGRFESADVLAHAFDALLGDRAPVDVVVMCGSGVTACHHLLAMAHADRPGARLYTGSWSGWIEDPARQVATGD